VLTGEVHSLNKALLEACGTDQELLSLCGSNLMLMIFEQEVGGINDGAEEDAHGKD